MRIDFKGYRIPEHCISGYEALVREATHKSIPLHLTSAERTLLALEVLMRPDFGPEDYATLINLDWRYDFNAGAHHWYSPEIQPSEVRGWPKEMSALRYDFWQKET